MVKFLFKCNAAINDKWVSCLSVHITLFWNNVLVVRSSFSGWIIRLSHFQKQPFRGVPTKSCSENMQQIYRRTLMSKCNFIEITLLDGCSPVNLLHILRTPFRRNTSWWLLPHFTNVFISIRQTKVTHMTLPWRR